MAIIKKYISWVNENKFIETDSAQYQDDTNNDDITLTELNSKIEDKSDLIRIKLSKKVPSLDISKMKSKEYVDKIQYIINNAYNIVEFEDGSADLLINGWGDNNKVTTEEHEDINKAINSIIKKEGNSNK